MLEEGTDQQDLSAEKKTFSRIGFSFFLLIILTVLFQIALLSSIRLVYPEIIFEPWAVILISIVPMYFMAAPCTLLVLQGVPSNLIEKRSMGAGHFFKILVICIGIMWAGNILGNVLSYVFGLILNTQPENIVEGLVMELPFWPNLISLVIIAPVVEEYIFRRVLIAKTVKYGEDTAIIISALFFALVHGNFYQFFYAFGLGAVFAYVYIKTGKLWYTVVLHMIINFLGSVVAPAVMNMANTGGFMGIVVSGIYSFVLLGAAITGIVLFFKDVKTVSLEKGLYFLPKEKRFSTIWLNAGTIAYITACIFIFVVNIAGITF